MENWQVFNEVMKIPDDIEIPINMKDWTDFNYGLKNRFNSYIKSIRPEHALNLLQNVFWPWSLYDKKKWKIKIVDVTLREWDQAPLTSFNKDEKKVVYLMLRELWINTIEVWFPGWNLDYDNIKELLDFFKDDPNPPYVSVLWRANELDTDKSLDVLKDTKKIRIHTFIATSEWHIIDKFCKGKWKNLKEWKEFVKKSIEKQVTELKKIQEERKKEWKEMIIEFSPEDATNSKYNFLLECIRIAIKAWANIINVPDTLGISIPDTYKALFYLLKEDTKDLKKEWYNFSFSTHVHNDKDMAMACTLWWIIWWGEFAETTLLWIWERTGNTKTSGALINFWIDWESNWNFTIEWIKQRYLSIFSEAVRKILWDDPFTREPWIWKNAQIDASWVHLANPWVYWWSKKYADEFWVSKWEKYFSPRWWINWIFDLLNSLWFEKEMFSTIVNEKFKDEEAKKAETSRRQYPSQIFKHYLEDNWEFSNLNYDIISEKKISINFEILWEKITINEDFWWESWYIDALIKWFKKYLWESWRNIILENFEATERQDLTTIVKELKRDVEKFNNKLIWRSFWLL